MSTRPWCDRKVYAICRFAVMIREPPAEPAMSCVSPLGSDSMSSGDMLDSGRLRASM